MTVSVWLPFALMAVTSVRAMSMVPSPFSSVWVVTDKPLPLVRDRKFVEIDRDNFNDVLASIEPRLALRVSNRLKPDANDTLNVELRFKHMDDFGPVEVINQVPALRKLYEGRQRLRDLLTKLDGNDDLASLLNQVIANSADQEALKQQLGGPAAAPAAEAPPTAE